jgi:ribosome-associated toxin RatA of RatAB toxin-antitoxin module
MWGMVHVDWFEASSRVRRRPLMREVRIVALVSDRGPDDVFAAVTDLERFPELSGDVREVRVTEEDGVRFSAWKVHFRGGVLEWTERDDVDPDSRTLAFRQVSGDFQEFHGEWRVETRGSGVAVVFTASFDLGIPGLRAVLEPIAAKSLRSNLSAVLRGLFGPGLQFEES